MSTAPWPMAVENTSCGGCERRVPTLQLLPEGRCGRLDRSAEFGSSGSPRFGSFVQSLERGGELARLRKHYPRPIVSVNHAEAAKAKCKKQEARSKAKSKELGARS